MSGPTMDCGIQINVLLLVSCCFVILISTIPCNGATRSNNEEINKNISSPANFSSIPEASDNSDVSSRNEGPVFLEGGSTALVIPPNTTVKTSTEEPSLTSNNEKRPNHLASDLESLATGSSSNHNHVSKARKGVNADDIETLPSDFISEHTSSSPTVSTAKIEQTSLKYVNNITYDSSQQTSPTILNKNSSIESHSSSMASMEVTTKHVEPLNKTVSADIKSNENTDTVHNSTLISTTMLSVPKLKPEFTRVDSTTDDQSSFAFSSENDYVIPVVAIIFAAPLFAILGMILYKRSKEFWERRHYRRMDFLIDGMYND